MAEHAQPTWDQDLFRLLVENTTDYAIFSLDLSGLVKTWNAGAERVLGYTASEALGRPGSFIFTPEDIAKGEADKELRQALATGRASDDRWHVRKDGTRFWSSGVLTLVRDDAGQPRGLARIIRDYTEQKQVELALRESAQRLRAALAAAEMGTWLWDVSTNRDTLDDNFKRLLGVTPDAKVNTLEEFLAFIHPDDREKVRAAFTRAAEQGSELNTEFRVVWPDGSIHWLRDQGKAFPGNGGTTQFVTGACVDITERKRLENELRRRAEELAEIDRRKDEFLAMLGHELRNPLAPIRSILEVLRLHKVEDRDRERAYAMIDRQVSHLTRLVDDLLDVSRITRGKIQLHKEPVELAAVVNQAVEMSRPLAEQRAHELMVSLPTRPVWLEADRTRLTQVLFNLLGNAAKYTERGGRIWLSAEREGDHVVVRVRDTGIGITPDLLPRIFDIFTQGEQSSDRSQGGLGLGLALVKYLIDMHGGSVEATSLGPGRGSEFIVHLPALPAAPATEEARPQIAVPAGRSARVLVVDDIPDVAESLAALLTAFGHEVRTAHDGVRALEEARAFHPEIVLLDIGLPGMDGYEVARRLRREPGLERVVLAAVSGYGQEEDRRRSTEAGFNYHLVKPVRDTELLSLLGTLAPTAA